MKITDVQQARAIVKFYGTRAQDVIDDLYQSAYEFARNDYNCDEAVDFFHKEEDNYVVRTANEIVAKKGSEILAGPHPWLLNHDWSKEK